jgi:spore coat polysaccharide biosynthesis protein SpsF (cytidylyltransferase family)
MPTEVVAIIQARMGSSRLPGKVLLPLLGSTVIDRVITQVRASRRVTDVVVATTTQGSDDPLVEYLERRNVPVFRGAESDVLDRFYQCATRIGARNVARITADCPFVDPMVIDAIIDRFEQERVAYASNVENPTFPDGLDVEVFTYEALKQAWIEAALPSEREHVTPYIRNHPKLFSRVGLEHSVRLDHLRWTLDQQEDYDFLTFVSQQLPQSRSVISMGMILEVIQQAPHAQELNAHIQRNEGLLKSLREDTTKRSV